MTRGLSLSITGLLALSGIALTGCHHDHGPDSEYYAAPAGYVYEPTYYDTGHYDGDYWAWRDRDGRWYREDRAMHEQRMREHEHMRHEEHEEHEEHEHH